MAIVPGGAGRDPSRGLRDRAGRTALRGRGSAASVLLAVRGEGALYQRLYESLRRTILEGRLAPGARLPSTRALAAEVGVCRNTVLLAYELLLGEGYVVGRAGSGTYVAAELPDAMLAPPSAPAAAEGTAAASPLRLSAFGRRLPAPAAHVRALTEGGPAPVRYNFRPGLPGGADFPHEVWRRILARRARRTGPGLLGYGPPEGDRALREAIADYLRRSRAVNVSADQVVVVNGSQQALDLVTRLLVDPGDAVVVEEPHYLGARHVFGAAGARLLGAPVDAEGADVTALPPGADAARLAYVTPSHQFPTGVTMSLPRRLALLAWAERTGAYVLEDDYDSEYRYAGRPLEAVQGLDRRGRVIYAGTFSKVLFPALRIGYVVLPHPLVEPFAAARWLADRHTPSLGQAALADFIAEGHFERHLRRCRARTAARRAALLDALDRHLGGRIEVVGASAGMHLLAWLRDTPAELVDDLVTRGRTAGVGIHPVAPFYLAPPRRAGLLLGYAAMTEREIEEGIRRLAAALA